MPLRACGRLPIMRRIYAIGFGLPPELREEGGHRIVCKMRLPQCATAETGTSLTTIRLIRRENRRTMDGRTATANRLLRPCGKGMRRGETRQDGDSAAAWKSNAWNRLWKTSWNRLNDGLRFPSAGLGPAKAGPLLCRNGAILYAVNFTLYNRRVRKREGIA